MLSKKAKYALKALIILGKNYGKEPMKIASIAESEHIPQKFLEQILLLMRNAGLLHSKKGAGGGYILSKNPEEIFLLQVLQVTNGPIAMVPCISQDLYYPCTECKDEKSCGIRDVFSEVRDANLKIFSKTSISDLIQRESKLRD